MRYLKYYKRCVSETLDALPWDSIGHILERLHDARLRRASIFICGNGGSAATASHFVNDLNKGANAKGMPRFRAMALVDNTPLLTAWSNDSSYADAFAEQLRNLARPGDLVIGISGSGNSPNVLNAVRYARQIGATTIGLTGGQGGKLAGLVDLAVIVPNACMEQIEDVHMFLEHALVSALRDRAQRERVPSLLLPEVWPMYGASGGLGPLRPRRGAVFVSRDGILVDPACGWDGPPAHSELTSGAVGALRALAHHGLAIVVVGDGARPVDCEIAENIHRALMGLVHAEGGRIDAVTWCAHGADEGCGCYGPEAGLLRNTAGALNLDLAHSYLLADSERDVALGMGAGCRAALVLTARGREERSRVEARWGQRCKVLPDVEAATQWVLSIAD